MHIDPESPYYEEFLIFQKAMSERLKELRREHGYTQLDMAETGISKRHYERFESDETTIISLWQMFRIAKHYEMTASELIDVEYELDTE